MKRRKVQAQRKFAQGVYIPPSSHTANIDKVTNPTIHKDNEIRSNIFHSRTSAKSLLDLISFQNLHKHREPVVLLERLTHYPDQVQTSSIMSEAAQQYNISQIKKVTTALKHNMCLRSKKKLAKFVKRLRSKNISIIKNKRRTKVNKDAPSLESIDSCNEDDKPLMYLAKEEKKNKAADKTLSPPTLKDKKKKVSFHLGSHGHAAAGAYESKQKYNPRRQGSAITKDGLRRRSIVHTRSHGSTAVDTREVEQETPLGPGRRHHSRSLLKTGRAKRQRLRTRTSRRLGAEACESDLEELHENYELGCSSLLQKTGETKKTGLRTRRSLVRTVDDASETRQEEPKIEQPLCNYLVQNTESEVMNPVDKENPQKVCSSTSSASTSSKRLKTNAESIVPVLGLQPVVKIELSLNLPDSSAKLSQVNSMVDGQSTPKNSIGDIKPSTGSSEAIISHAGERKIASTYDVTAQSQGECNIKTPSVDKYLSIPLISRRLRNVPCDKLTKINHEKKNITKKQTSGVGEHCESIDISSKIKNRRVYCPSKNYSTMNDVIYADPKDLEGRCERCNYCGFIDKVQCVSNMFKIQYCRKIIQSKINGFDAEAEESVKSGDSNIPRQKNRHKDVKDLSTECHAQTCYLIYDKDSDHVVEVKRNRYANQVMQIESANIVPKTSNTKIMKVTALDTDHLLDDIIHFVISRKSNATVEGASDSANGSKCGLSALTANGDLNATTVEKISARHMPILKASQTDAPIFYPTEQEFGDPIAYFSKIMPIAAKFGLCKVVAPNTFKPKCVLDDEVRFEVTNQYISRLYKRWGPASRELCAIKAYLASQSVIFSRPPLLEGVEVNLPKLYYLVQTWGGLKEVIEKKRWTKVAEEMNLAKTPKIEVKLDQIYVKYILPYDTMTDAERKDLMKAVDNYWSKKHQKMLQRAMKPLHRQKRLLDESESSEEDIDEDIYVSGALAEAEDCISNGRQMNLLTFKKVASKCMEMYIPNCSQNTPNDIEHIYWKTVLLAQDHICVNNASIDTGEEGYGFTKDQRDSYGKHPWNLKVLSQNSGNVLRFLGPVLGVTVPTLHLGMVFSTSCWHRDPHGLPWIEYMHTGPGKIWYGIPDEQSDNFRRAVELLCPTSCQNKSIWLPSDITMIPPDLLLQNNVSMSRVVQEPGQFIVVFPKAYSCSIATGYTESESVYFATNSWLETIDQVFQEVRESCEPTMFSLEHLLVSAVRDPRAPSQVLNLVNLHLGKIMQEELNNRNALAAYKIQGQNSQQSKHSRKRPAGAWNVRDQDECEICQATLYLSKVRGLTDKKRSLCLQHALQLLDTEKYKNRDLSCVELELFFSDAELERIITKINSRI